MARYQVSFFKHLLSSNGHPAKALQGTVEVRHAKSMERAVTAAKRRFERRCELPHWSLHADTLEVQGDGRA